MNRRVSKTALLVSVALGIVVALFVVRPWSAPPPESSHALEEAAAPPSELTIQRGVGQVRLTFALPAETALSALAYAVVSASDIVIARGNVAVDQAHPTAQMQVVPLPAGQGNRLTVVGTSNVDGVKRTVHLGSRVFDVVPGQETAVNFTPGVGAGEPSPEIAAAGTGLVVPGAASADDATACQSCELSSAQGICDSPNITATSSVNPQSGEQTGIGWGCGTLRDPKAQAACQALLHCLNVNDCSHPGQNPVTGCYCGGAAADQCIGGQGINGACVPEYQSAALVSAGGPPVGAPGGQLSQFIATASSDPTTPIGLANNIKHCATETHCDACGTL